jgi:hypothetical protein
MQVVCKYFGATDGYTEQNQNGDRNRSDMWQHGTNDRSTLTQTGDRNTNTSNQDDGDNNLSTALTRVMIILHGLSNSVTIMSQMSIKEEILIMLL